MGLGRSHKRELKMKSTYTTKKKGWSMQVEWKWCNKFSKDNLKHKLYTTHNLWEEALVPPYSILYASLRGLHSNVIFSHDSQMGSKTLDAQIFLKYSLF